MDRRLRNAALGVAYRHGGYCGRQIAGRCHRVIQHGLFRPVCICGGDLHFGLVKALAVLVCRLFGRLGDRDGFQLILHDRDAHRAGGVIVIFGIRSRRRICPVIVLLADSQRLSVVQLDRAAAGNGCAAKGDIRDGVAVVHRSRSGYSHAGNCGIGFFDGKVLFDGAGVVAYAGDRVAGCSGVDVVIVVDLVIGVCRKRG